MADEQPKFDPFPKLPPKEESQPTAKPIRWLVQRKREDSFNLDWPFLLDGKEYRSLTVRRMTAGEIATFIENLRASTGTLRFPVWRDERGDLLPDDVWNAMDDDDRTKAEDMQLAFLPQRFLSAPAADQSNTESSPPSGDTGDNTSPEKPDTPPGL